MISKKTFILGFFVLASASVYAGNALRILHAQQLKSGSGTVTLNTTGTITVPGATDTLVGRATSDTLTNKVLSGNTATNLISGSGTLTLNTTGTVTVPNGTDTLVARTSTDTLTNKTISGASNTITNVSLTAGVTGTLPVANGGTGAATLTANNVLLGNTTSPVQFVAPGTSGNVLTSNGTTWISAAASSSTTDCHIYLTGGNGHGSTNTVIRRFVSTGSSSGSCLTYADSATNGGSITINTAGNYSIMSFDTYSAGVCSAGASVNASGGDLTTSIAGTLSAVTVRLFRNSVTAATNGCSGSATVRLAVNDVVRAHTNGNPDATGNESVFFRVTQVSP